MVVSPSTICPHTTIHLNLYPLHYIALPRCFQSLSDTSKMMGGVAGCTALIICGFAINDTVDTIGVKQYEHALSSFCHHLSKK